jgi:hypothetical protein
MKTDTYTKVMLTIIAAAVLWISLGGPSLITPVQAQNPPQRVTIAGWESSGDSKPRGLPLPVHDYGTSGLPSR